ncbi:MAG: C40 family peptidase [Flammeovirgaceae bacterium]
MTRLLLLSLLLGMISYQTQAQNFQKLEKLYQKQHFDKLKKAAHKLRKKYKKKPEPYLYLAKAEASNPKRIGVAWNYYKTAYRKDRSPQKDVISTNSQLTNIFRTHLSQQGETFLNWEDTVRATRCAEELIRYFQDSTLYAAVQPPPPVEAEKLEELPIKKIETPVLGNKTFIKPSIQPKREDMVNFAEKQEGVHYFYTGEKPETGFDCSGFVLYVYRNFGYNFMHSTKMAAQLGKPVELLDARPGDFVCFGSHDAKQYKRIFHMGMVYSNDGTEVKVIHATVSKGVKIDSLTSGYWSNSAFFIRNVMD